MIKRLPIYNQMLNTSTALPQSAFIERLKISPATFKRDITILRKEFDIPVVYSIWDKGYYLADRKVFDCIFGKDKSYGLR